MKLILAAGGSGRTVVVVLRAGSAWNVLGGVEMGTQSRQVVGRGTVRVVVVGWHCGRFGLSAQTGSVTTMVLVGAVVLGVVVLVLVV